MIARIIVRTGLSVVLAGSAIPTLPANAMQRVDSISLAAEGIPSPQQIVDVAYPKVWVTGPGSGILAIDLSTGKTQPIGRVGSGPGEYRRVAKLFSCDSWAGWIDDQLQRVTWFDPKRGRVDTTITIPSGVLARGRIVDAWCTRGEVWFSSERPSPTRGGRRTDSLVVFRLARASGSLDTIGRFEGTHRLERSRGALRLSLRIPYTLPPSLQPGFPAALISRAIDSLRPQLGANRATFEFRSALPNVLGSADRQVLQDSIRSWFEDDMDAQKHPAALRREFRVLLEEVLAEMRFPARLPTVRMARYDRRGGWAVIENGAPNSSQTCISHLSENAQLRRAKCFNSKGRDVADFLVTAGDYWVIEFNSDDAWLQRIPK